MSAFADVEPSESLQRLREAFGSDAVLCAAVKLFNSPFVAQQFAAEAGEGARHEPRNGGVVVTETMLYVVAFDTAPRGNAAEDDDSSAIGASAPSEDPFDDSAGGMSFDVVLEDVVESITHLVIYVPQEEAAVATSVDPIFELRTFAGTTTFRLDKRAAGNELLENVVHAIGTLPAVSLEQRDVSEIVAPASAAAEEQHQAVASTLGAFNANYDASPSPGGRSVPRDPPPPAGSPPSTALSSMTATPLASPPRADSAQQPDDHQTRARGASAHGGSAGAFSRLRHEAEELETQLRAERERLRTMMSQSLHASTAEVALAEEERRRGVVEDEAAKRCNIYLVLYSSTVHLVQRTLTQELEETRELLTNSTSALPDCFSPTAMANGGAGGVWSGDSSTTARTPDFGSGGGGGGTPVAASSPVTGGASSPKTLVMPTPASVGIEAVASAEAKSIIDAHEKAARARLGKFLTSTQRQLTQRRQAIERDLANSAFMASEATWRVERQDLRDRVRDLEAQLAHSTDQNRTLSAQLLDMRTREQAVLEKARRRESDLYAEMQMLRDALQAHLGAAADGVATRSGAEGRVSTGSVKLDDDEALPSAVGVRGLATQPQSRSALPPRSAERGASISTTAVFNYFS